MLRVSQEEVAKFAVETKDDELRVMGRKRTDVLRRRDRPMSKEKKESRKKRVRKARGTQAQGRGGEVLPEAPTRQDAMLRFPEVTLWQRSEVQDGSLRDRSRALLPAEPP